MSKKPVILSIAGIDPSGGAGIVADVKTIAALDCFPATVITSITFQNTMGVFGASHQTAATIRAQIEPILNDLKVAAAKTGMLPTREIISELATIFRETDLPAPVVDPVMRATSGDTLIEASALNALRDQLFPLACLVTPNIPEAERLANCSIGSVDEMRSAATVIQQLGARAVLIKGGHAPQLSDEKSSSEAIDVLLDETGRYTEFRQPFFDVGNVHGSGCTLSAAIASYLGKGKDLVDAIYEAKLYVTERIRLAEQVGRGALPL